MSNECKLNDAHNCHGFLTKCSPTTLRNVAIDLYEERAKARWEDIFEKRCDDLSFLYWSCCSVPYVCEKLLTLFHEGAANGNDNLEPWTDLRTTSFVQLLTQRTVADVCMDIIAEARSCDAGPFPLGVTTDANT